ncbi:MAG: hypothetical protein RL112_2317 [Planctomycetota bacterium]
MFRVELPASCVEAWDWHARQGAFERLVPPFDPVRLLSSSGTILEGDSKVLALPPFGLRWVARHGRAERGALFVDSQERGPFASFVHHHRFAPSSEGGCWLSDELDWRLPLEPASLWIAGRIVRDKLARMFAWRHHVVVHDLAMARALALAPLRLELAGEGRARGHLAALFDTQGHQIAPPAGLGSGADDVDARMSLEGDALLVEPRRGQAVRLASGRILLEPRDLDRPGPWTLLEELAAAALLAAAGRLAGGARSVVRLDRPQQASEAPLPALELDGLPPPRWTSRADLAQRLRGRIRAVEAPQHGTA